MINGFDVFNTVRALAHKNNNYVTALHYSLTDGYAVFGLAPIDGHPFDVVYSVHVITFESDDYERDIAFNGQYGLTKAQAAHAVIERFDDLQGGAQ